MICPHCRQSMVVVEHHQIELDYCPRCEGVWFDAGELELLLQSVKLGSPTPDMKSILNLPPIKSADKPRKCPICHLGMRETALGEPALVVDVCLQGDGLWFDGGEVHQLLGQLAAKIPAAKGALPPVVEFLGEVFKAHDGAVHEKA